MTDKNVQVWDCKITVPGDAVLPFGFDWPPRNAACSAIEAIGVQVLSCASGWGGKPGPLRPFIDDGGSGPRERSLSQSGAGYTYPKGLTLPDGNGDAFQWPTQKATKATPTEAAKRKAIPLATGVVDYFPLALLAVAELSRIGNEQHNPGQPLRWDRSKSGDESDALMRHFVERGTIDTDGVRHSAKVAWRALALLQKEIESNNQEEANHEQQS